jgi:hypothetical protein
MVATNDRVVSFEFCGNIMDCTAEDEKFLSKTVSAMKQHFIFLGRSTGITSEYGEVKILTPWLNTQGTARR